MNESQATSIPSAEDYFEICVQMLAAAQALHETTQQQSQEIRYLIAELRTRK